MNITSDMAEILLRQFMARSELLAPLGSIAETCWLIMLRIYSGNESENNTAEKLADAMNMPVDRVLRYIDVLCDANFIEQTGTSKSYLLVPTVHSAVDNILVLMIQDILSSLER
jgi:hypothetical protein